MTRVPPAVLSNAILRDLRDARRRYKNVTDFWLVQSGIMLVLLIWMLAVGAYWAAALPTASIVCGVIIIRIAARRHR